MQLESIIVSSIDVSEIDARLAKAVYEHNPLGNVPSDISARDYIQYLQQEIVTLMVQLRNVYTILEHLISSEDAPSAQPQGFRPAGSDFIKD